jgi:Bacterial archaeo-eukaryotic release factor family 3
VSAFLRGDTAPLLLAAVESEVAIYRRVNSYPRLNEKAVNGSPDVLSDAELHQKAMYVIMQSHSEALEKALSDFEKRHDTLHISGDLYSVIKAVWEGRVTDLFFSEDAEFRWAWNKTDNQIDENNHPDDLLNAAALQTVLHGGWAFVVPAKDMPLPQDVVAVLRF